MLVTEDNICPRYCTFTHTHQQNRNSCMKNKTLQVNSLLLFLQHRLKSICEAGGYINLQLTFDFSGNIDEILLSGAAVKVVFK